MAGNGGFQTIHRFNDDFSPAYARRLHTQGSPLRAGQIQHHGVGMRVSQARVGKRACKPRLPRVAQAVAQAGIIHRHAQQSANQRAVGAVPLIGFLKRAPKPDACLHGLFPQQ
ncbi:hypothetical protein SDC9_170044 [bioreactor metagenome]|uniref:Uncharacterized protein n=1 Tax=bioreactor metagenome TaxID=1076179 RepID=A0A645G6Z1_9ZZZZ